MIVQNGVRQIYSTYTGKVIDPLNITPDDIDIRDIAHALSNLCRYNGHIDYFFSVAQHSVLVAQRFPVGILRMWGLLHDAPEAYLGDVVTPLKYSGQYDFYFEVEDSIMNAICDKFGMDFQEPPEVKEVDMKIRGAEMRDLRSNSPKYTEPTYSFTIKPWLPTYAKQQFLMEAEKLGLV